MMETISQVMDVPLHAPSRPVLHVLNTLNGRVCLSAERSQGRVDGSGISAVTMGTQEMAMDAARMGL